MSSLPVLKSCSGHGTYKDGLCHCDSGWTGLGDYNPVDGLDCGINTESIIGLSWTSLVLGGLAQVVFVYYLIKLVFSSTKIESSRTRMKFMIFYSVQTLTCNIYDILAIIDHKIYTIGGNVWTTICVSIAWFTAYGGCVVYFEVVMKLLGTLSRHMNKDGKDKVSRSVKDFYAMTNTLYIICFVCSIVPLVGLVVDADKCYIVGKTTLLSWELFHAIFLYAFNPPMTVVRNELTVLMDVNATKNISNKTLKSAQSNLLIAQVSINFLIIFTTVTYLIFGVWDYLSRKLVYVTLYCTIGVHVLSFPMLLSLTYKKDSEVSPSRVHSTSKYMDSTVYNVDPFDEATHEATYSDANANRVPDEEDPAGVQPTE